MLLAAGNLVRASVQSSLNRPPIPCLRSGQPGSPRERRAGRCKCVDSCRLGSATEQEDALLRPLWFMMLPHASLCRPGRMYVSPSAYHPGLARWFRV